VPTLLPEYLSHIDDHADADDYACDMPWTERAVEDVLSHNAMFESSVLDVDGNGIPIYIHKMVYFHLRKNKVRGWSGIGKLKMSARCARLVVHREEDLPAAEAVINMAYSQLGLHRF
jgi:hypothetical protein